MTNLTSIVNSLEAKYGLAEDTSLNKSKILTEALKPKRNISVPLPNIGDLIQINCMVGEPQYTGKRGKVTIIDDMGQIHGT